MILIGFLIGASVSLGVAPVPVDGLAYWLAGTSADLYPESWAEVRDGYLFYPPPVAQISALLQPLGWPLFITSLMTATFWAFWFCARQWSFVLVVIGVPYYLGVGPAEPSVFLSYALLGNFQWLLAALSVLAFRRPATYAVLVLTKVTTAVGWWWHVFREEWHHAAIAAWCTLAVLVISVLANPNLWAEFLWFVKRNMTLADPPLPLFPIPFFVRLPMAVGLVMWGARTGRRWTVPVAAGWSLPALYGLGFMPFFVAATRLVGQEDSQSGSTPSPAATPR